MLSVIPVILLRGREVVRMRRFQKLRSFEELKKVWDIMDGYSSMEGEGERTDTCFSMMAKTTGFIMKLIYPQKSVSFTPVLRLDGEFSKELSEGNANPYISEFLNDLFHWFEESPYWDTYYGVYGSDDYYEDGNGEKLEPEDMAQIDISFFEDEEIEKGKLFQHLKNYYDEYMGYGESAGPGFVIIVSYLYPYLKKIEEVAGEEDKELISYLKDAFGVISGWMIKSDDEEWEVTKTAGYFLSQGGQWDTQGYGLDRKDVGCGDFLYQFLLAGEMVESTVSILDEKYNVLPEHLKRKEEGSEATQLQRARQSL